MSFAHQYLKDLSQLYGLTKRQLLAYFNGRSDAMRNALRAHQAAGLITISTEFVRGRSRAERPIVSLRAGELPPCAEQIAYQGRQRWNEDIEPTIIIRGTAKLFALYGGEVRPLVTANISHDLALSDVFLTKRREDPAFEWNLVHAKPGSPCLDAVCAAGFIEVVGQYSGVSVAAKLSLTATANLELW
jgi:hypothetical protein